MNRTILLIIIFITFAGTANAQFKVLPNMPYSTLNSNPGFVSINELNGGIGLHWNSHPYSYHFFGFTTVYGYQLNRNFLAGAGTGLSFYDAGLLIPLFLDFRLAFHVRQLAPYIFADGGLLLEVSNINDSKVFINPGGGVRYTLSRSVAVNLAAGVITQMDGINRASFINLKAGVIYVF